VIDSNFWKDRNVFITGHTGFKGGWLALWLNHLGAKVSGYALPPPDGYSFYTEVLANHSLERNTYGDIRNLESFTKAMQSSKPSVVIHLAAQPLVIDSYLDPINTYSTNVMGTVNMFEAIRKTPSVKAVLNITTDKCYENNEQSVSYKENDPMGGHDPYSTSKGCSELVSASYRKSFFKDMGVALATARAGNVIGGGDWAKDRIIPDAMNAFANKKKLIVRNPNSIRPWQHVLEPLFGYLMLCQKLINNPEKYSDAWNFGPNQEDAQPVSVLADIITKSWGDNAEWGYDNIAHPHEANYLKLNCSKANNILKWEPKWSLNQTLFETVKWYKAFSNNENMSKFTLKQIEQYTLYEPTL
tara:strand:- start:39 stop:1109 length:1071 start_codon:yes stop_codon:yes gene_type:complete